MKTNLKTKVPARDNRLVIPIEPGSATPPSPAASPNGGKASNVWWDHIKALDHYDPAYPYDPGHIYGPDWTDDDAYGKDGVTLMAGPSHQTSVHGCHDEAQRRLGLDRVFRERCLRLPDLGVPKTNRYAQSGRIIPDIFIQEKPRPGEDEHEVAYDPDNPILFVLEVLSRSTFHRDLESKVEIYQAMGVREYWRYDPRRWHRKEGEPRLWGLRLSAAGEYETVEPVRHEDGQPVYRSDTLGEFRMLDEGGTVHTFQTWNATRGAWLDPIQATALETQVQTRIETQTANLLTLLRQHAAQGALAPDVPDTQAAAWRKARWVPDFDEALRVTRGEWDWSSLLPPGNRGT
ncbi:MAG: Uma2 family endonuclease [Caldilineaceae bacterium]|nr:Uma2 family endonuclease [Caldilineaceae bacterium]